MRTHYNGLNIISHNAIYNFIISNRNYGKTWTFKRRAWRRAIKRGRKTIWLRLFKNEKKEAINTFYNSPDLQAFCGINPYDPDTKKGNFKQIGNTCYYRDKRGKWHWFLKIYMLSEANAIRSSDDVNIDTIVFDEFTTTPARLKRYRGNVVDDFNDIFYSIKREHKVWCFFLGNKENVLNPFLAYFGIKPLPHTWQGIRTYRNGAIAIEQRNNEQAEEDAYDKQLKSLFTGTKYGDYLYKNEYKGQNALRTRKMPAEADTYIQIALNGFALKIGVFNGFFYVNDKPDITKRIYTIEQMNKYKQERLLVKRQRQLFTAFINAISDHRVYYSNISVYSAIQPFYAWLGL